MSLRVIKIILPKNHYPGPQIPEINSRTQTDLFDILVATASSSAGGLAFATGASSAVIGVMVAIALLPPLAVCGLLIGAGFYSDAAAAFLLFMTNILYINLAGVFTFLTQGVSPENWWETEKARKATRNALMIWTAVLFLLTFIIVVR